MVLGGLGDGRCWIRSSGGGLLLAEGEKGAVGIEECEAVFVTICMYIGVFDNLM